MAGTLALSQPLGMPKGRLLAAIGTRLISARTARSISASALARALRVTRSAVAQWESGTTAPSTENLAEAAIFLRVSSDWLATGRGQRSIEPAVITPRIHRIQQVPLVSWVSAGQLVDSTSQIPIQEAKLMAFANLGRGDFFALRVQGDSMDRLSPDGSIIVVNREDRNLNSGKAYVFSIHGQATYKLWEAEPPHLAPFSTNPTNRPIFLNKKKDLEVLGRVKRTMLDL